VSLVLSLFPGGGLLDHAFALEGFCVVRGPDVLWGGDIREFHPPAGKFDGIIGGDPCQSHSALANLVRAKGLTPSFPDLTPEYERVVNESRPAWFLRENVPAAPDIKPDGYDVRSFMLDNSTLDSGDGWGNEQMRKRRFWFGVRDGNCPELRQWIDFALFELPDAVQAVAGDAPSVPVAIGGSGKRKVTAVGGHDGTADALGDKKYRAARARAKAAAVATDGRHGPEKDYSPPRRTLEDMMALQGMPEHWFEHSPFTMQAKRKICGNAVALPTGRMLARAVLKAIREAGHEG
jgi:DNA (cytosine-5)-methyltransferase 1